MITYILVVFSIGLIIGKSFSEDDPDSEFMSVSQAALAAWFTVEYATRWNAVRPHISIPRPYSFREFWEAKVSYMTSFMPMIDLLSFLPYYIEILLVWQEQGDAMPSGALGVLRVVRVLRIFKLTRNNQTISDFFIALYRIRKDLLVFLCVLIAMIIVFASAIFYAERNGPYGDQFHSIPICMWWTVITFSSVGYGDMYVVLQLFPCYHIARCGRSACAACLLLTCFPNTLQVSRHRCGLRSWGVCSHHRSPTHERSDRVHPDLF